MNLLILKKKILHGILLTVSIFLFFLAGTIWWAVGTSFSRYTALKIEKANHAVLLPKNQTLRVVTYNIAHGQGIKARPTDWRNEVLTREKMTEVTATLKEINADIVLLQEVDLKSNRTHYIDEAKWLVDKIGYPYWACAPIWEKNYIPFPFWPIEHHLGEVKTANCVLSKYPLSDHKRLIFDKPESNPFWYNWGYIDRGAQYVVVHINNKELAVVNVHFEDQDESAREKQARDLLQWISSMKGPMILGGDFNAPPKNATRKINFDDEPHLSYIDDDTVQIIHDGFSDETQAISEESHQRSEKDTFTFPANAPNRRIDHIFALKGARITQGRVIQEAGLASDHLPVAAEINF